MHSSARASRAERIQRVKEKNNKDKISNDSANIHKKIKEDPDDR